jgi:hypothetical protein
MRRGQLCKVQVQVKDIQALDGHIWEVTRMASMTGSVGKQGGHKLTKFRQLNCHEHIRSSGLLQGVVFRSKAEDP